MRRFSDDALLQCLTVVIGALFIAWGYGIIRAFRASERANDEANELRKEMSTKMEKLIFENGRLSERLAILEQHQAGTEGAKLRQFGNGPSHVPDKDRTGKT